MYFVRELTDSTLWKLSLATGSITPELTGLVPYCSSCWAAANDGIYFLGTRKQASNGQAIFFHNDTNKRTQLVTDYPEALLPLGGGPFSLSPDGKGLLCVRVDPSDADVMHVGRFH